MRSMMLLINPFSGRGVTKNAIGDILTQLCRGGYAVTAFFVGEESPEQLAYEHAKNYETLVCVGGDGTLSSVFSGIIRSGASVPVGYIPAGTANDMATTHALSKVHANAIKTIINGKPLQLDVGLFCGRYFAYIAAFGAFTSVSYLTSQNAKRALGHFAYVLGGVAEATAVKAFHAFVEHDGGEIEGDFIFGGVTNSTSVAGLVKFDPECVVLDDGLFEVVLVKQPANPADLIDILTGLAKHTYDGENLQLLHSSNIKFRFEEDVAWTIDGEDGGSHREVEIANCRKAVGLIV